MSRALEFALILTQAVLVQALSFGLRPTLSYAVLDAGGDGSLLGVLTAAYALPALLLALPLGTVMDRIGERTVLILGPVAMLAAAGLALASLGSIPLLIAATALVGLGHLSSVVATQAIFANRLAGRRPDAIFGYYTFAASLGQTLGPLLIALPSDRPESPPITTILLIAVTASVIMLALSLFVRSSPRTPGRRAQGTLSSALELLRIHGVIRALLATSIVLATIDLFVVYLPLLGQERGLSTAVVSSILVARSGASMVSRLFLGVLLFHTGRRSLTVVSIAVSALMLALLAAPLAEWLLIVLSIVFGFFVGICQPITLAWISELAPPGTRGLAMSLRLAANRVGQTALPAVLGVLAIASGAAGVLLAAAGALGIAAWSSAALPRPTKPQASAPEDG